MGIKRRNKISAEFSMSSLTDIIFLLLIFFMLTSSLVKISMDLPESNARAVAPSDISVTVKRDGSYQYNGRAVAFGQLYGNVSEGINQSENRENSTVTIIAERGVEWKRVSEVMKIANSLSARAIIATQPREE